MSRLLLALIVFFAAGFANAEIIVRSSLSEVFTVRPGGSVEGVIAVENTGASQARVRLYKTDYTFQADGTSQYGDPGSTPRSNAEWVEIDRSTVTIPPGVTVELSYRVAIPTADLEGSYWSVIMIEEVVPPPEVAQGVAVKTVVRYGLQVVTEIAGTGNSMLEFSNPVLVTEDSGQVFQVDAVNSGDRMLRGSYYLELYSASGTLIARIDGVPKRTYPGTSIRQQFSLGYLEAGKFTAVVVADAGADNLFGAQYQLNVSE